MQAMFDLTNIQPQVKDNLINAPNLIINPTNTSIVFDKVKFQYTEGRELFDDLSFEVPAGKEKLI
jgi:ABC-type transport system involved in Fe-S cluster assembly fused permease/ATPase subunit